ncbi:MAG: ATP-dependent Clp protease ATP-binding subunit, partial [Clostridia bacterium]|nr:ATP-dependent Clp protease ATP-binding subunit [Clostridia bacterium]
DEVHNLVGTGDAEGSMSAANILKPALSRGEIQVVGATTFTEYRKYIEKDSALERRFQPVKVEEPSIQDTVDILEGIKDYYENYHKVKISDDIIRKAVIFSERYITDRYLPDKAIDLIDEASAHCALSNREMIELEKKQEELQALTEQEEEISTVGDLENIDYEKLASLKQESLALQNEIDSLSSRMDNSVREEHLAKVIELWTGIPAARVQQSELKKLAVLEENILKRIVGQDEAVKALSNAVRRSRVQLSKRRRPASFIFVGPTGVGKTELVKVLSQELFDTPETLIRLDMSEFMEKHSVSRIIGSPPGYVGYDEAGQLTEKVRRKPYSVILFDEIEKAHPDVMNILLQILDEGRITDAHGRTVNFENTVIVMTSNAGSQFRDSAIGFGKSTADISREKAMKALSDFLRPEFISRVDEIIVFNPLSFDDMTKIAGLMLEELREPLEEKGIKLAYSEEAQRLLAQKAGGGKSGARDLRNVIRREIEDKIASIIVNEDGIPPKAIVISESDGNIMVLAG